MTVAQAAHLLEVTPATVYSLCAAGKIGHLRVGVGRGTIRIEQADVDRYRATARREVAAPAASPGGDGDDVYGGHNFRYVNPRR